MNNNALPTTSSCTPSLFGDSDPLPTVAVHEYNPVSAVVDPDIV